ncbi:MAG: MFS transporter [Actinomycetia bacterium]|nr:MFS transporter [Actinomycetes bacterium]MCP5034094.1 MFS transporter [Actinomycetes bacterium]
MASTLVWIPVFVLFTRARFGLDGAVLLSSLYYLFVVVLEVPSGWMSDRLGRVLTLRVAAVSWLIAQTCYLLGNDRLAVIVIGQFFLAGGFASLSGTDVTFHFDTLEALGRADEYVQRQARVSAVGFTATALSAVIGGLVGLVDLRMAFVASLVAAVAQLITTMGMSEPPASSRAEAFGAQLRVCVSYLRDRYLGWIFFYGVALVTLEHVAVTLMQPWLTEVLGRGPNDVGATPLFSGVVFAAASVVGALSARVSAPLSERFGTPTTLVALAVLSATIVTSMALWVSAWVLILVAFRSAQGAAAPVLISGAVAPRVMASHRATLLSINSLAGRLGFGLFLCYLWARHTDDVSGVLGWFSIVAWTLVVILTVTAVIFTGDRPGLARSALRRGGR